MDAQERMLLLAMENANAWVVMTAAQANHDIQKFGEWRVNYDQQAGMFQADYDKAGRELLALRAERAGG